MIVRLFGDENGYRLSFAAPGKTNTTCYMSPDESRQARDELLKALPLTCEELRALLDKQPAVNGFTVVDDPWKDADFVKGKYDEACLEVARLRQDLVNAGAAVSDNIRLRAKVKRLKRALKGALK